MRVTWYLDKETEITHFDPDILAMFIPETKMWSAFWSAGLSACLQGLRPRTGDIQGQRVIQALAELTPS
jgi:hypothetical protein